MSNRMRDILQTAGIHVSLGFICAAILFVTHSLYWPVEDRFVFHNVEVLTPVIKPGQNVIVKRTFTVSEPGGATDINKTLECKKDGKTVIDESLPSGWRTYRATTYDRIPIPYETPSYIPNDSDCVIDFSLVYKVNFLRSNVQKAPQIKFKVEVTQ